MQHHLGVAGDRTPQRLDDWFQHCTDAPGLMGVGGGERPA